MKSVSYFEGDSDVCMFCGVTIRVIAGRWADPLGYTVCEPHAYRPQDAQLRHMPGGTEPGKNP